ncbi:helix-turn-helix domain-containing protein [Pseudomonas gingeri]|nr:helix-turn-helix domain-containing protein [Pseudomonas gingeri]NVZ60720.1 helix-turn-helix domain-containing protein [Pseudomonas gingeri]NVZ75393.1 helix-turn-helix domain-containing protein [Pseudomonas gingeri]
MFDFTILVLPGAFSSGVGAALDILSSASDLANQAGCAVPRWRVCSTQKTVPLSNGLTIEATLLPERPRSDSSIWLIPGLGLSNVDAVLSRLAEPDINPVIRALKTQAKGGGTIAASCSAVFLLQAAGLLTDRRVTTTWWLGGLLQRIEPRCTVDVDQMVVCDANIVTGGAAFAHIDLMLHLLRSRYNPALAEAVSRAMVIDGRQSQAQYIVPAALASGNELATRLVACFEAGLPNPPSISELAAQLCMSSRTLSRHIKESTGRSVSALLQSVRINRARMLLETSRLSVEQVAQQVGYADTTALRRLMRKVAQATPSQFRPMVFDHKRDAATKPNNPA